MIYSNFRALLLLLTIACLSCGRTSEFPFSHITQLPCLDQYQPPASIKLTEREILKVTSGLKKYLSTHRPAIAKDFTEYYFQLIGYQSQGQSIVLVNAFHEAELRHSPDWQTQPILVKGGGEQYWKARYSLTTDSVIECWVNAEK